MANWRVRLKPVADQYLDRLAAKGFAKVHAAYDGLMTTLKK